MIFAVVLCLSAIDPAPLPPVLRGIDQLPSRALVETAATRDLLAVALDDNVKVVHRARAIRLLGARPDVDPGLSVASALVTLRASPIPELRVHAALAQGARAARQGQGLPFAAGLLHDEDVELRRAALTLLWIDRSAAARDVVFAHGRSELDPALQELVRHRLQQWSASSKRRR